MGQMTLDLEIKPKKNFWLTPPELYEKWNEEFHFNYDPCPFPRPVNYDGIEEEWGSSTFCNPPFKARDGGGVKWIRKAGVERDKGKLVVLLLPVLQYTYELLSLQPEVRPIGRLGYLATDGSGERNNSTPSMLFILRPQTPNERRD